MTTEASGRVDGMVWATRKPFKCFGMIMVIDGHSHTVTECASSFEVIIVRNGTIRHALFRLEMWCRGVISRTVEASARAMIRVLDKAILWAFDGNPPEEL